MPLDTRPVAGPDLALTGERTLPGIPDENYWFRRHEAAYRAVRPFCVGAVVLDAGCGEGYGSQLLAEVATVTVAVDYDAATVAHARQRHDAVDVVLRGDVQRLPVADATVDVVSSLQVLEHSWDQPGLLAECARVLRPGGTLALTTPNRLTFSPGRGADEPPLNPFHTREVTAAELRRLLAPEFVTTRLLGLRHGRRLRRHERRHGSLVDAQLRTAPPAWPARLRRVVHAVHVDDFEVSPQDVDAALDLLVVARRRTAADPAP